MIIWYCEVLFLSLKQQPSVQTVWETTYRKNRVEEVEVEEKQVEEVQLSL